MDTTVVDPCFSLAIEAGGEENGKGNSTGVQTAQVLDAQSEVFVGFNHRDSTVLPGATIFFFVVESGNASPLPAVRSPIVHSFLSIPAFTSFRTCGESHRGATQTARQPNFRDLRHLPYHRQPCQTAAALPLPSVKPAHRREPMRKLGVPTELLVVAGPGSNSQPCSNIPKSRSVAIA